LVHSGAFLGPGFINSLKKIRIMEELDKEVFDRNSYQGRRKDQVESNIAIAYFSFCLLLLVIAGLVISSFL
jgi:hypothetical protein